MARIRDRVVIVTGASAGIGRDTAARLVARGAVVVGAARDEARLAQVEGIDPVRCDVAVDEDRDALVAHTLEHHGRIDALVNNAGVGWEGRFVDMPPERVRQLFEVNVLGLVDLCRRVLPPMLDQRSGDVVNVSSVAGFVNVPFYTVYSTTKAAVNAFTLGLRREVWGRGVRVHLVNPGPVRTEWMARAQGYEPTTGADETRNGGIAAVHVARAIERCLRRPWPRSASVPRALGSARLLDLPVLRQAGDGAMALANRAADRIAR